MDLSVVIVNYNVRSFLENALSSVRRATEGMRSEIFVVDNASDDGSAEMVRTKFPDVCLIENSENVGFARANNMALQRAKGKYILLINPDTVVQEDTLKVMKAFFEAHPEAGLAGCKILNPDGSFQLPCRRSFPTPWVAFTKTFGLSTLFPRSRLFGRYNLTYLDPEKTYEVDAVSGSFMMISRAAYEKVGGLDETFFMYGEDLDWCYRVRQSGFKVYYVHATKIIHFKGESTRRSSIDEVGVFYQAMKVFVEKHYASSGLVKAVLNAGIMLRASMAFLARAGRPVMMAVIDLLLVDVALLVSAGLYWQNWEKFPAGADPVVWYVPALVVVGALAAFGAYRAHRYSSLRAAGGVIAGYVVISALVFFAKAFAYSRAVVVLSGVLSFLLIPGWRLMARLFLKDRRAGRRKSLFGSRTLIVGTGPSAQEVLRKLRERVADGYDVLGFIDVTRRHVGERIAGLEVVGSIDNVGKVIDEQRVGEVIFSTDGLSYTDILSVISRSSSRSVNYRLVPNSLEAIIGKTRIDELGPLPLVDIEYNIRRPFNRFMKRTLDSLVSALLLVTLYPLVRLGIIRRSSRLGAAALAMPQVLSGRLSLVGRPRPGSGGVRQDRTYLGPYGITGLAQISAHDDASPDEEERYLLYYAKNQSLILDCEILMKALLQRKRRPAWQK